MATVYLSPIGNGWQFFDDNGVPLNGGFINTYAAGTTTPQATYTTQAGTVQNANPIALNAAGRIATQVWLLAATAYKFVPVSSVSVAVGTAQDNIYGIGDPATQANIGVTGATVSGAIVMNLAPVNEARGSNVSVAAAINLNSVNGNAAYLTGSGTITSIQLNDGWYRELIVQTVSCAIQNNSVIAMLGQASVTPAVGDIIGFRGDASPVVRNVLYQRINGQALAMSTVSNVLAADVFLNNTGLYFDGPSVSVGPIGTWYVSGNVTLTDTSAGTAIFSARLWDGTTFLMSPRQTASTTGGPVSIAVSGVIKNPVGPLKISINDSSSIAGAIKWNSSGAGFDSVITAVRIA